MNEALCGLYAAGVIPGGNAGGVYVPVERVMVKQELVSIPAQSDGNVQLTGSVVVTGAALGLPGRNHEVFAADNIQSLLSGDMRIEESGSGSQPGNVGEESHPVGKERSRSSHGRNH